ncbi:MAG: NAD(P)H-binding protein [Rhodospirillaceae bacterium]|nr:NAD(P)H-binding protein [Rhodospirillaceae bacterium]
MNSKNLISRFAAVVIAGLYSTSAMALEGPVLVFGGTSGTGLGAAQNLRAMDVPVTVFVRPTSDLSGLEGLGVNTVVGNALNADDVDQAFATDDFKIVISSLGGRRGERRPDLVGNLNITAAAKANDVSRVIQVSSMGVGATREPPAVGANFMAGVLYIKTLAEDDLISSGLDYTIVRPGGLRRGEATGTGIFQDYEHRGSIDRQELGRMIVTILDDQSTYKQILYAWDPTLPMGEE